MSDVREMEVIVWIFLICAILMLCVSIIINDRYALLACYGADIKLTSSVHQKRFQDKIAKNFFDTHFFFYVIITKSTARD